MTCNDFVGKPLQQRAIQKSSFSPSHGRGHRFDTCIAHQFSTGFRDSSHCHSSSLRPLVCHGVRVGQESPLHLASLPDNHAHSVASPCVYPASCVKPTMLTRCSLLNWAGLKAASDRDMLRSDLLFYGITNGLM